VCASTEILDAATGDNQDVSDAIPVPQMLDHLRDLIEEASLIRELPIDTKIFRVRVHGARRG